MKLNCGLLLKKLELDRIFFEIESNPNSAFNIPKCFNCNEFLSKEDLEFLAERMSTSEVEDSIDKHYVVSLDLALFQA